MGQPQQPLVMDADADRRFASTGKMMIATVVVFSAVVVSGVVLHMLAKWYIARLRRQRYQQRRDRYVSRSQILMYIDRLSTSDGGLEPEILNSLPLYYYKRKPELPPTECVICLSELEDKEVVRLLPKCNHCFHIECVDTWFRKKSTCPVCRSSVEEAAETVIRPVWKVNVSDDLEEGNSSGRGRRVALELLEVRIEMPRGES